jgi:hypothetical protein
MMRAFTASALQVSLDYMAELDYSLFIHDEEITRLLKGYEQETQIGLDS